MQFQQDENHSKTQSILARKREINLIEIRKAHTKNFFASNRREVLVVEEQFNLSNFNRPLYLQDPSGYLARMTEELKFAINEEILEKIKYLTNELFIILADNELKAPKLVIASGIYKVLLKLIAEKYTNPDILDNIYGCFINMAFAETEDLEVLVEYEVFEFFINILEPTQSNLNVIKQILWFFANATGSVSSINIKKLLIKNNITIVIMKILLLKLDDETIEMILWLISNVAEKTHNITLINKELQNLISCLTTIFSENINKKITCLALQSLKLILGDYSGERTGAFEEKINEILKGDFIESVSELVFKRVLSDYLVDKGENSEDKVLNEKFQNNLLNILNSLTFGNEMQTKELVKRGFLKLLFYLMSDYSCGKLRLYASRSISNISGIDHEHSGEFFNLAPFQQESYIDTVLNHIKYDEFEVKIELIFCLCNLIFSCNEEQIQILLDREVMKILVGELILENEEQVLVEIIKACSQLTKLGSRYIDGQRNPILLEFQRLGGHIKIEALQIHKSDIVYEECGKFIDEFFQCD